MLAADDATLTDMRGRELSMIFQNPRASLNPIRHVGEQIADVLLRHANLGAREAAERAVALLAEVGIPDPSRRARACPFEPCGAVLARACAAPARGRSCVAQRRAWRYGRARRRERLRQDHADPHARAAGRQHRGRDPVRG
jgi:hypothetical protein